MLRLEKVRSMRKTVHCSISCKPVSALINSESVFNLTVSVT